MTGTCSGEISTARPLLSGRKAAALDVAQAAARAGLRIAGIFTFPGQSYAPGMPLEAAEEEGSALGKAADLLAAAGFPITRRSGGSTPTAALTGSSTGTVGATEIRPGVYVFGDAQQLELERCAPEDIALTIAATVVSRQRQHCRHSETGCGWFPITSALP